jgi:hypothetical protein
VRSAGTSFFWLAFLPRLLCSAVFSLIGYLGEGGDPEIFHLFGLYIKDIFLDPDQASLDAIIWRWGYENPEPWEDKYYSIYEVFSEGEFRSVVNTTAPIITIHALIYALAESPFLVVALSASMSAWANARFGQAIGLSVSEFRWLAFNPVSIYFAGTHYKEAWSEVLLLLILVALEKRQALHATLASMLLLLFRITYAPFIAGIVALRFSRSIDVKIWIALMFSAFLVLPPLWWDMIPPDPGPVYSVVHTSDLTRKLLGPLVGLIQPVPFLAAPTDTIFGLFLVVYGLFHGYLLFVILLAAVFFRCRNFYVVLTITSGLALSYYVVGGAASKARFFAPFMPVMIAGYLMVRPALRRWAANRWASPVAG